ncbi:hypothetical protein EVG20_g3773 [Dentipellis fragilis]|uniref:BHLH domain-containing protein n=1 Tax=Dentipellis fragilis TaxID=205917 RepID=A0A4Y9Z203_9AGAM|nr:hypothetical protein EVG20_g3773 [Dentipellis fragilis]
MSRSSYDSSLRSRVNINSPFDSQAAGDSARFPRHEAVANDGPNGYSQAINHANAGSMLVHNQHMGSSNRNESYSQYHVYSYDHQNYQPFPGMTVDTTYPPQSVHQGDSFAAQGWYLSHMPVEGTTGHTHDYSLALPSSGADATNDFQQAPPYPGTIQLAEQPEHESTFNLEQHTAGIPSPGGATSLEDTSPTIQQSMPSPNPPQPGTSESMVVTVQGSTQPELDHQHASTSTILSTNRKKRKVSMMESEEDKAEQKKTKQERAAIKQRLNRERIMGGLAGLNLSLPPGLRSNKKKPDHRVIDNTIPYLQTLKDKVKEFEVLKLEVAALKIGIQQLKEVEERLHSQLAEEKTKHEGEVSELLKELENARSLEHVVTRKEDNRQQ